MFVGLNSSYIVHLIRHTAVNKFLILLAVLALISIYPSTISIMSARKAGLADYISEEQYQQERKVRSLLKHHADISNENLQKLTTCIVRNAIIDRGVVLPENTMIGFEPEEDRKRYLVTPKGVVVVVKNGSQLED